VSVLALALVIGLSLTIPSLSTESVYAQAADIAQNSPQVRAALGDGEVQVVKVIKVVDDKGTVICQGEMGVVTAEVDLKTKEVTVVSMPELTEAERAEAIQIAEADPRVKELLDDGATIGKVSPMYSFGTRMNPATGETEEFSGTWARVAIELGERNWFAEVDLAEGKVVMLIKMPGKYEEEDPVEEPAFRIGKDGIEKGTQ